VGRYSMNACRPYVGQMVHVQTRQGMHRGVVESVTSKGLYLRPMANQVVGDDRNVGAEHVYFGGGYGGGYGHPGFFGARLFVPFLTILALTSLLWW
jgi:hypothetical protein